MRKVWKSIGDIRRPCVSLSVLLHRDRLLLATVMWPVWGLSVDSRNLAFNFPVRQSNVIPQEWNLYKTREEERFGYSQSRFHTNWFREVWWTVAWCLDGMPGVSTRRKPCNFNVVHLCSVNIFFTAPCWGVFSQKLMFQSISLGSPKEIKCNVVPGLSVTSVHFECTELQCPKMCDDNQWHAFSAVFFL